MNIHTTDLDDSFTSKIAIIYVPNITQNLVISTIRYCSSTNNVILLSSNELKESDSIEPCLLTLDFFLVDGVFYFVNSTS